MKKITIGILAHVDAGKTTLSEDFFYLTHKIKQRGRVDHQDAYLDYESQERDRGITIYSKEARFNWQDTAFTLIDTPGHIDFSFEMERSLQVIDYAILLINASDGVQAHTKTIWQLLEHYSIPTFLFINKMDLAHQDKATILQQIQSELSMSCLDFSLNQAELNENIALLDEHLLNYFLEVGTLETSSIQQLIQERKLFPCLFGSALKNEGVKDFLNLLAKLTRLIQYDTALRGRVYKITRDKFNNRWTHIKLTGGHLKVKQSLNGEKIDQICLDDGLNSTQVEEIEAGEIASLKGLKNTYPGQALGQEQTDLNVKLTSYFEYRILPPVGYDYHLLMKQLQILEDEDPQLHIHYLPDLNEIRIQLMGDVQIEILKNKIQERYHIDVEFDQGSILYKETILDKVEGVGHFEPLRHYAEVHLLLEPGARNSGIIVDNQCKDDQLSKNYQNLIFTHIQEIQHPGVLTGANITDLKITLLGGRAHVKHTEGGDFREATYRAIRQGLKKAQSVVLEPYYDFEIEVPADCLSKVIFDLDSMDCCYAIEDKIEQMVIKGSGPVEQLQNYTKSLMSFTKGKGKISCQFKDYEPCLNQEEVIHKIGYDSELDVMHPTGSVFCKQGAGFYVPYDEVENYMHLESFYKPAIKKQKMITSLTYSSYGHLDDELEAIFEKTYGKTKVKLASELDYHKKEEKIKHYEPPKKECLLVDGYNVIHAWPELKDLAKDNLDAARVRLIDILASYQGFKKCELILVFDAYKVKGNKGSMQKYHDMYIVYTKESQTADMYIERTTHQLSKDFQIIVATSDALEQIIILGNGGRRISSRELRLEVEHIKNEQMNEYERKRDKYHSYQLENLKQK